MFSHIPADASASATASIQLGASRVHNGVPPRRAERRRAATWLLGLGLCALASGCAKEKRDALPVPADEQAKPQPEERALGRLVKVYPVTIANALAGLTRGALTVHVTEAKLGARFSWLRVADSSGATWAITPPLAATPTGDVTLTGWVRQRATVDLPHSVTEAMVLWTAHVGGAAVQPVEMGEEAVIDPVFAAMELTGTVARAKPPRIVQADLTIAALHADKARLEGKRLKIRGQVIHVIPDLSGRTWWLLRDGKSDEDPFANGGDNVLLVAANAPVEIGDVVLVEGTLVLDRAFTLTSAIPVMLMPAQQLAEDSAAAHAAPAAEVLAARDAAADATPTVAAPANDRDDN